MAGVHQPTQRLYICVNKLSNCQTLLVRIDIECDYRLAEMISDFLLGVAAAAISVAADPANQPCLIRAFVEVSAEEVSQLLQKITDFGNEATAIIGTKPVRMSYEPVCNDDWAHTWKAYFKPFTAAPGLIIAPTWEIPEQGGDGTVIVMDPGMAFGTGHHQTTRLCLHFLHETINADTRRVLDVGAGTGVLAMAAALYGAHRVTALDSDPEARAIARANIETNHLGGRVWVSECEVAEIDGEYDIVVANIVHDVLLMLAADLVRCTAPGGSLFVSGLAGEQQARSIVAGYGELGMKVVEVRADDQWYGVYLKK
jgi:ribosomal protein L11 methyltransferase